MSTKYRSFKETCDLLQELGLDIEFFHTQDRLEFCFSLNTILYELLRLELERRKK